MGLRIVKQIINAHGAAWNFQGTAGRSYAASGDRDFGYGKKEGEEKVVGDSLVWGKQDKNVRKKTKLSWKIFFRKSVIMGRTGGVREELFCPSHQKIGYVVAGGMSGSVKRRR